MKETLQQLWQYLNLLIRKWVFWIFTLLAAIAAFTALVFPNLTIPQPVYWGLAVLGVFWVAFQVHRDTVSKKPRPVIQQCVARLNSPDQPCREAAIDTLSSVGSPEAQEALVDTALNHQVPSTRFKAAFAAAKPGESCLVPTLITALESDHIDYRQSSANALAKIGPTARDAVSPLCTVLLEDKIPPVRLSAGSALGKIGHPSAVDVLRQCLIDEAEDVQIRRQCAQALDRIPGDEALKALARGHRCSNRSFFHEVDSILEKKGTPEANRLLRAGRQYQHIFGLGRDHRRS